MEVERYGEDFAPDPDRIAGVDLGIIHPFAVVSSDGAVLVSGRAMRAESRLHLAEAKARGQAVAQRAPSKGQRGSRRWRKYRARSKVLEARHHRRLSQARHEGAKAVVDFARDHRIGTLVVGDPRGVLSREAGARQNLAVRNWRVGLAERRWAYGPVLSQRRVSLRARAPVRPCPRPEQVKLPGHIDPHFRGRSE